VLELIDVHKRYGDIHAVRGVSLSIPRGQVAGILGPNGAGKSTTMRMILGSVPPTSGRIRVNGLDTLEQSRRVRAMLGYLPEANPLYPEMTVREYLGYRTRLFSMTHADAHKAVDRALDACRLGAVRGRTIGTLSKGFRQRVGLAAAIVHTPKLVILDEPTSGLDPAQIAEMRGLIRDLASQATVLIVSHVLPEVERACDRVVIFAAGRVLAEGTPAELLRRAASMCVIEARPPRDTDEPPSISGAVIERQETLEAGWRRMFAESPRGTDPREAIARAFSDAGWAVRELRPRTPTLEALYLDLLAGETGSHTSAQGAEP